MSSFKRILFLNVVLVMVVMMMPFMSNADVVNSSFSASIQYGVRAIGMGGAFVSITDDGTITMWNPAGIAFVPNSFLLGSYADLYSLGKIKSGYLAYVQKGSQTTGALYWTINAINGLHKSETEDFDLWNENTIAYEYAVRLRENMALGAALKGYFLKTDLEHSDGRSIGGGGGGLDIGFLMYFENLGPGKLNVGLNIKNIYGAISWHNASNERIPIRFDIGTSYEYNKFLVAAFSIKGGEEDIIQNVSFGVEGWFLDRMIGVRAGVNKLMNGDERTIFDGGFTVEYEKLGIEYGFTFDGDGLGNTHNVGVYFRF